MGHRETLRAIRDRGDLDPWLNGETECLFDNELCRRAPIFTARPERYTFRPKPAPPKLRPWTWDELWAHRDCWFRKNGACRRLTELDPDGNLIAYVGEWVSLSELASDYKFSADGQTWLPCETVE
jgi:hypothetical protein